MIIAISLYCRRQLLMPCYFIIRQTRRYSRMFFYATAASVLSAQRARKPSRPPAAAVSAARQPFLRLPLRRREMIFCLMPPAAAATSYAAQRRRQWRAAATLSLCRASTLPFEHSAPTPTATPPYRAFSCPRLSRTAYGRRRRAS